MLTAFTKYAGTGLSTTLPNATSDSSVTVHVHFIFEFFLASYIIHFISWLLVDFRCVPPHLDPARPFVREFVLHIHTTCQSGLHLESRGEQDQPYKKCCNIRSSPTVNEKILNYF